MTSLDSRQCASQPPAAEPPAATAKELPDEEWAKQIIALLAPVAGTHPWFRSIYEAALVLLCNRPKLDGAEVERLRKLLPESLQTLDQPIEVLLTTMTMAWNRSVTENLAEIIALRQQNEQLRGQVAELTQRLQKRCVFGGEGIVLPAGEWAVFDWIERMGCWGWSGFCSGDNHALPEHYMAMRLPGNKP